MDPIVGGALKLAIGIGKSRLQKLITNIGTGNDATFIAARTELFQNWIVDLHNAVKAMQEEHADRPADVDDAERSPERLGVLVNYAEQAWREPMEERRTMLAYLAAGVLDVKLTAAEFARVQRRIDELEPDDLLALDAAARCCSQVVRGADRNSPAGAQWAVTDAAGATESLTAAGCVRPRGGFGSVTDGFNYVSSFGGLILKAARHYLRLRRDSFSAPGREEIEGSRSEAAAREELRLLAAVDELHTLSKRTPVRYLTRGWHYGNGTFIPPPPTGMATLSFEAVDAAAITELVAAVGTRPSGASGEPISHFSAVVAKVDGRATRRLDVHGPHDVLRWLAEDLDAEWITVPLR